MDSEKPRGAGRAVLLLMLIASLVERSIQRPTPSPKSSYFSSLGLGYGKALKMESTLTEYLNSQDELVREAALALPHQFSQCSYSLGPLR